MSDRPLTRRQRVAYVGLFLVVLAIMVIPIRGIVWYFERPSFWRFLLLVACAGIEMAWLIVKWRQVGRTIVGRERSQS